MSVLLIFLSLSFCLEPRGVHRVLSCRLGDSFDAEPEQVAGAQGELINRLVSG